MSDLSKNREIQWRALRVSIVEDDPDVAATLARVLQEVGIQTLRKYSGAEAFLRELDDQTPDVVFTDLIMPGIDGFELIRRLNVSHPQIVIIVVSAYASLANAVEAVRAGAFDFVAKPFDMEAIESALTKIANHRALKARLDRMPRIPENDPYLDAILGRSAAIAEVRRMVSIAREVEANVLIEGETGTGKELVAKALHAGRGPFVAVNVATVVDELAESELFGHRKGAFTGATENKKGLVEAANGGVLFLDEINSMSRTMQAKVLRMIQERRIRPVGSDTDMEVDFRLICATNESLEDAVVLGRFRLDLYHRINVIPIRLPPLRERREDIEELAAGFVARFARLYNRRIAGIDKGFIEILKSHDWPGNVRELENVIERAVIFSNNGERLTAEHLDEVFRVTRTGSNAEGDQFAAPLGLKLRELEARYAQAVLEKVGGNKSEAARLLGIDYKTLVSRLSYNK